MVALFALSLNARKRSRVLQSACSLIVALYIISESRMIQFCNRQRETELRSLELEGKTVIPGLIDAHMHVLQTALSSSKPDLSLTTLSMGSGRPLKFMQRPTLISHALSVANGSNL